MTLPPIRKIYVDCPWGQVHVRTCGNPAGALPPLLMLHPTPKSGWIYEPLMPLLAAPGRLVIAPDTPGYGASDPAEAPPSIEDLAAAILALVGELGGDRPVDAFGYHTGSVIAVAMAEAAPDKVRKLVLVSLAAYDAETRAAKRAGLANWPGPREDGSHLTAMWALVGSLCDARAPLAWRHQSVAENLRAGPRTTWGYDAVYRYDLIAALPRVAHPALVLDPEDDLRGPTSRYAATIPGVVHAPLDGTAHGLFDFDRTRIAALVDEFLKR